MPSAGLYAMGVSLTLYTISELHAQCWFTCGFSLTNPMLASFLGSFSHKVYAGFFM